MRKKIDGTSINKTYIWVAIIIGAAIIGYGMLNFISKENERNNQATQARANEYLRQTQIDKCFADAEIAYTDNWNSGCKARGLEDQCTLPSNQAENIEGVRKTRKEDCLKRYPQN